VHPRSTPLAAVPNAECAITVSASADRIARERDAWRNKASARVDRTPHAGLEIAGSPQRC
jgi:hypothetical protein